MTCTVRMNREHEAAGPFFGHVGDDIIVLLRVRLMQNGFAVFEHVRYIVSFCLPNEVTVRISNGQRTKIEEQR